MAQTRQSFSCRPYLQAYSQVDWWRTGKSETAAMKLLFIEQWQKMGYIEQLANELQSLGADITYGWMSFRTAGFDVAHVHLPHPRHFSVPASLSRL